MNFTTMQMEKLLENRLHELLAVVPALQGKVRFSHSPAASDRGFDFEAVFPVPRSKDRVRLAVMCKKLPRPSQFPKTRITDARESDGSKITTVPVLAAPFISPRIAGLCEEHHWGWYDLAGNCRLMIPGGIYIERRGRPAVHEPPKPKANLGTSATARVLRALLAPSQAGMTWTQTDLQQHFGPRYHVSIGLVNKVISHLRDEAWIAYDKDGRFHVADPTGLLKAWSTAYRFDRHQRMGYFSLLKPRDLQKRLAGLNSSGASALCAAFSAADFQAPSVRQGKTWLYVNAASLGEFEEIAAAKEVDSGENLVVLIPEDDGVFYLPDAGNGRHLACTNEVQTWLDLMHAGGRGEEAAEAILNQCLKPRWLKGIDNA